ncbi:acetyl-CoA carboxylase biotin carboxyl carrier protein [Oceanobacillus halotolerans]|uniref:acetyl-CoA carboxylase biotin carboxyl carrier protein n=1 Tax=Oceanobacillus halotolerans TaxID=2663380 RepID=UPI0013DA87B1|nr:acetyl-CoA carboxylase biotin carboxyl carrier protein [Oceanobacillus halotolerans]
MLKVQEIRELIKLIDQSSIDEFTYESNGTSVTMKKGQDPIAVQPKEPSTQPIVKEVETDKQKEKQAPVPQDETETQEDSTPVAKDAAGDQEIVSPMVGTFYAASSPESDPYVKVGSRVENDTIVCIVEAMKLFNEIEAEVTGEIVEVLVQDGELVEYGQPLFRVKTK